MDALVAAILGVGALTLIALSVRVVKQFERGVLLRFGRLVGERTPGLRLIIPVVDVMHRVSVGQHTLDETLAETDRINEDIRKILDVTTLEWGVEVTLVELKDIQLPETMKRAMAKQAEAEREKRAKIINAEGESLAATALGQASDVMMAHPLALQLRNLQSIVEIGVDKNTTVVFPAPLMSTIGELGAFLAREEASADAHRDGQVELPADTAWAP
jgi:regulator of protease activity HflC (stomatin/prohibitin superfamily)